MYTWGGGGSYFNKGQLGHGHLNDIENPEMVMSLKNKFITKFSCGGYHTMALTDTGDLYSWGSGIYGECGFGEVTPPIRLPYIDAWSDPECLSWAHF